MATATGFQSVVDLQRDLLERQRQQYQRLQRAALTKVYRERTGLVPDNFAIVEAHFAGSFAGPWAITPARHLTSGEVRSVLSATATG